MTKEEQRIELLIYRIKDNCYEEAKKLLKEYSEQIRADAIDEYRRTLSDICCRDNYSSAYLLDLFKRIAEQLKSQDSME